MPCSTTRIRSASVGYSRLLVVPSLNGSAPKCRAGGSSGDTPRPSPRSPWHRAQCSAYTRAPLGGPRSATAATGASVVIRTCSPTALPQLRATASTGATNSSAVRYRVSRGDSGTGTATRVSGRTGTSASGFDSSTSAIIHSRPDNDIPFRIADAPDAGKKANPER